MKTTQTLFNYMSKKSEELHKADISNKDMPLGDVFRVVILRSNIRTHLPEIKKILNG
jgi:hypothetical protein